MKNSKKIVRKSNYDVKVVKDVKLKGFKNILGIRRKR
jgi:hypothetical protein